MKSEKGQAIVFLALGFVVFLGFVGLALDGGMLYSDRRHAQNGTDASSLAGAGVAGLDLANQANDFDTVKYGADWSCNSYEILNAESLARNKAVEVAGNNGFSIANVVTDTDSLANTWWTQSFVSTHCEDSNNDRNQWIDVTVNISDTTETSFAQVLYPQPLHNVVSATARIYPKAPFGLGNAIVALRDWCGNDQEGGAHFGGSNDVNIIGGGVFSNACIEANGAPGNPDDPNQVVVDGGDIIYLTEYNGSGDPLVEPPPEQGSPNDQIYLEIPEPDCLPLVADPQVKVTGGTEEIDPGTYTEISVQGGTLIMNPGLYCIIKPASPSDGDGDVLINGGTVEGPAGYDGTDPYPTGVSFFLDQGSFTVTGNPTVRLTAALPNTNSCQSTPCPGITEDLEGVLIYLAEGNTGEVTLTGTGDDVFTGLVFVPDGTVNLVGTGTNVSFNLQIFADTVDIGGNAVLNINYDDEYQKWTDVTIELAK